MRHRLGEFLTDEWQQTPESTKPPATYPPVSAIIAGVPIGERDNDFFHLAWVLRTEGVSRSDVEAAVLLAASRATPPFPEAEALAKVESAWRRELPLSAIQEHRTPMLMPPATLEPGPRQFGIDSIEPAHFPTGYYGKEGTNKTKLIILSNICYATGLPFLGFQVLRPGPTIYLDWELNKEEWDRQVWHIARGMGLEQPPDGLYYVRMSRPLLREGDHIAKMIQEVGAVRIGIDSFSYAGVAGPDTAIEAMSLLAELGVTAGIADHQARVQRLEHYSEKAPYGSIFKEAGFRSLFQVEQGDVRGPDWTEIVLRDQKPSFTAPRPDIGVRITFQSDRILMERVDPSASVGLGTKLKNDARLLAIVANNPGITNVELSSATGIKQGTVKTTMSNLHRAGRVKGEQEGSQQTSPYRWYAVNDGSEPSHFDTTD